METPSSTNQMNDLKNKIGAYKEEINKDITHYKDVFSLSSLWKKALAKGKEWGTMLFKNKRVLLILGGIAVGYWLIRSLLTSNTIRTSKVPIVASSGSWFLNIVKIAMQSFLLYYAKKLLTDFLNKKKVTPSKAKTSADLSV